MLMARMNAKVYLERNEYDTIKATKDVYRDYVHGCYTNEEYEQMIDIIAGYGITGVI